MWWPADWGAGDPEVVWHGTPDELRDLCLAARRVCACRFNEMTGSIQEPCGVHSMLAQQSIVDHLLYVRRTREHFLEAEGRGPSPHPRRRHHAQEVGP